MPLAGLRIGASIGHWSIAPGTLGAFVIDRATSKRGILSNTHVLLGTGQKPNKIKMIHKGSVTNVGTLARMIALQDPCPGDAAFAWLDHEPEDVSTISADGRSIRLTGGILDAFEGMPVAKLGSASRFTDGTVVDPALPPIKINYSTGVCTLTGLIAVKPTGAKPFSTAGDSGSLVVTEAGDAVGLVLGGKAVEPELQGYTLVNPLGSALDVLKVDLAF